MDTLLFVTFVVLVLVFVIQIACAIDIGNFQFSILFIAFAFYLFYLMKPGPEGSGVTEEFDEVATVAVKQENNEKEAKTNRFIKLPEKLGNMINVEIEQLVETVKGKKDPTGNFVNEEMIDAAKFISLKDATLTTIDSSGNTVIQEAPFEQVRDEYFIIDKVLRDLAVFDPDLYVKSVFNVGQSLST